MSSSYQYDDDLKAMEISTYKEFVGPEQDIVLGPRLDRIEKAEKFSRPDGDDPAGEEDE